MPADQLGPEPPFPRAWQMDILVNWTELWCLLGFSGGSAGKNPPANAGDLRDWGSTLGGEDHLEKEMATHSSFVYYSEFAYF